MMSRLGRLLGACVAPAVLLASVTSVDAEPAPGHSPAPITALRFDPQGKRLAIGREDGSVALWDLSTKTLRWNAPTPGPPVHSLFFRDAESQLMVVELHGRIRVHAVDGGSLRQMILPDFMVRHGDRPERLLSADFDSKNDRLALAGDLQATVVLVDLAKIVGRGRETVLRADEFVYITDPDSNLAMSIRQEEPVDPAVSKRLFIGSCGVAECGAASDLRFCSAGRYLVATTTAGLLVGWDLSRESETEPRYVRKVGSARTRSRALLGVACNSSDRMVTIGFDSKFGQIQLWKTAAGEMLWFRGDVHPSVPARVTCAQMGGIVVTHGDLGYWIWRIEGEKLEALIRVYTYDSVDVDQLTAQADIYQKANLVAIASRWNVALIDTASLRIIDQIGDHRDAFEILPPREPARASVTDQP